MTRRCRHDCSPLSVDRAHLAFSGSRQGHSRWLGLSAVEGNHEHWIARPGLPGLPCAASRVRRVWCARSVHGSYKNMSGARSAHSEALLRDSQACNPMPSGVTRSLETNTCGLFRTAGGCRQRAGTCTCPIGGASCLYHSWEVSSLHAGTCECCLQVSVDLHMV